MKRAFVIAVAGGMLLFGPASFAQTAQPENPSHIEGSGQGGYLGVDPGAHMAPRQTPPQTSSMQGGYLGRDPGATMQPMTPRGSIDASSPPTAFCDAASLDVDRCRSRADADHAMCVKQMSEHGMGYLQCRRTLDQFGWRL